MYAVYIYMVLPHIDVSKSTWNPNVPYFGVWAMFWRVLPPLK